MAVLRVCTFFVLFAVVVVSVYAQLTFTPAWGKRSGSNINNGQLNSNGDGNGNGNLNGGNSGSNTGNGQCQASSDSMMLIHHIIQLEAQKLLECHAKDTNGF